MNNQKCSVEFWRGQLFELRGSSKEVFFAQLIHQGTDLHINRPVNKKGVPMQVTNDMVVDAMFYDKERGLCEFTTTVHSNNHGQIFLRIPSDETIKKVQRRNYFRVQVAVDMYWNTPSEYEQTIFQTHDISGGGISLLTKEKIVEKEDIIKGYLLIESNKIAFTGRVVAVLKMEDQFFRTSIEFSEMKESIRTKIIRFCMSKQIELRKKLNHSFDR